MSKTAYKVFIATSIDGYIADKNGGLEWLNSIPNPDKIDMGYNNFIQSIDAIVMGKNTFETVCIFDIEWPYSKKVFVISNSLQKINSDLEGKVELLSGELDSVLEQIHNKGFYNLYIDGGKLIQSFLKQDLIDEMIITQIPVLLGGGVKLFSDLNNKLDFKLKSSKVYLNEIVQNHYIKIK